MSNDKIQRWSGPAAALGGAFWVFIWTGWLFEVPETTKFWLTLPAILLVIVGLTGLYRRLAASSGLANTLSFGMALIGSILMMVSSLAGALSGGSDPPAIAFILLGVGLLAMILGIAGMGIVATSHKTLGPWSFVPLTLSLVFLGYAINIGLALNDSTSVAILMDIFSALTMIGWLLLGYSLWTTQEETPAPVVPA